MVKINYIYISLLLVLNINTSFGQIKKGGVGLVLSGGGARGVAHIGVIRALEDNNIPIDYISGTSFGALIGSAYASGLTTDELEEIITSEDFYRSALGVFPQNQYYHYLKKDDKFSTILKFRVSKDEENNIKIRLKPSLLSPAHNDFFLLKYLGPSSIISHKSFDSLMVPFRCNAADISNVQNIIFNKGNLTNSVRASSTFPFYFPPVKIANKYFFDGGIYNNFLSDVLEESFYTSLIIGSKVTSNAGKIDLDDIPSQVENLITHKTNFVDFINKGILIDHKNLENYSTFSFENPINKINIGYKNTLDSLDKIKMYIENFTTKQERESKRENFKKKLIKPIINKIILDTTLKEYQKKYIKNSYLKNIEGKTIDQFKNNYFHLNSLYTFDNVRPIPSYENDSVLNIYLEFNQKKTPEFGIGGNLTSGSFGHISASFDYTFLSSFLSNSSIKLSVSQRYNSIKLMQLFDFKIFTHLYSYFDFSFVNRNFYQVSDDFLFTTTKRFLTTFELFGGVKIGFPFFKKYIFELQHDLFYFSNIFDLNNNSFTNLTLKPSAFTSIKNFEQTSIFEGNKLTIFLERNNLNTLYPFKKGSLLNLKLVTNLFSQREYINEINQDNNINTIFDSKIRDFTTFSLHLKYEQNISIGKSFDIGLFSELYLSTQELTNRYETSIVLAKKFSPINFMDIMLFERFCAYNYISLGLKNNIKLFKEIYLSLQFYTFLPKNVIFKNIEGDKTKGYYPYLSKNDFDFNYLNFLGNAYLFWNNRVANLGLSFTYFNNDESYYNSSNTQSKSVPEAREWLLFLNFGIFLKHKGVF